MFKVFKFLIYLCLQHELTDYAFRASDTSQLTRDSWSWAGSNTPSVAGDRKSSVKGESSVMHIYP
jgi:hypothetical protein